MVSLAPFVLRRPWLTKMLMPAATWYANAAGYRKLGLSGTFSQPPTGFMRSPCGKESAQRYPRNPDFSTTPIAPLTILRHETITKAALESENRVASQEAEGKSPAQPEPHANRISTNRFDDLLEEEREAVQIAIRRLSSQESYDRIYRIRRATQCSYQHKLLPKEDWTTAEEDTPYLRNIIAQVEAELAEKDALDSMTVIKKH